MRRRSAPETADAPPLPNTYWVIPGRLLAGEYPGGVDRRDTRERLRRLLDAGIDCFVDLTAPTELDPYDPELPLEAEYFRKPIRDHGLPAERAQMEEIVDCIQGALRDGRRVYVHCRAGIGRTGMAVGCLLVERGLTGDDALHELNRLWQACARAHSWPYVPETDEQIEYVRSWTRRAAPRRRLWSWSPPAEAPRPAAPEPAPVRGEPAAKPAPERRTLRVASVPASGLAARFAGALVGLAVGDALAVATQSRVPGSFPPVADLLGGGPDELPPGAWSDDTAMALCLAESLLECRGFDARDQVARYTRWQQHGHLSATGRCVGITPGTARALAAAQWRRQLFSGSHDPTQLDPEPLSRVAPAVMYFLASPVEAVQRARDAARTTCQAPTVLEACGIFAAMLHAALSGRTKEEILSAQPPAPDRKDPRLRAGPAIALRFRGKARGEIRAGAGIVEVLEAALWVFDRTASFEEGALLAANLGESSDVAAAVFGQLAGAHYGLEAIPAAWRDRLAKLDLIMELAAGLHAAARGVDPGA